MLEFYGVIFLTGTIFTILGMMKMRKSNQLMTSGIIVEGKIVEIKRKAEADGDGSSVFSYPVFEFDTKKYGPIRVESDMGTSGNPYELKQKVKIIHEEEFPHDAEIYNKFQLVIFPRIFIATGLICITVGFLVLFEVISLEDVTNSNWH